MENFHKNFFILGSNQALSVLEILSLYDLSTETLNQRFLISKLIPDFDAKIAQEILGGTRKIGRIFTQFSSKSEILENLDEILSELSIPETDRITFGASLYGEKDFKFLDKVKVRIKGILKKTQPKAPRFLSNKTSDLRAATLLHNNVLEKGFELVFFEIDGKILVGQTESFQNIEEWSKRDYGKPHRNTVKGMMPPKLARMMLNLGGVGNGSKVLDPFCGVGTISQESLLLGAEAFASDIDSDQINRSGKNLIWLKELFHTDFQFEAFAHDSKTPFPDRFQNFFDTIAFEPFMGAQLEYPIDLVEYSDRKSMLGHIYTKALKNLRDILKDNGKIVMISPIFRVKKDYRTLNAVERILELGYKIVSPPEIVKNSFKNQITESGLIYGRNDQMVKREIIVLEKI